MEIGTVCALAPQRKGSWGGIDIVWRRKKAVRHHLGDDVGNPKRSRKYRRVREVSEISRHGALFPPLAIFHRVVPNPREAKHLHNRHPIIADAPPHALLHPPPT